VRFPLSNSTWFEYYWDAELGYIICEVRLGYIAGIEFMSKESGLWEVDWSGHSDPETLKYYL